jgi:hypothetical protein
MAMATSNHSSVPEGFKEIPGYDGRYFINQDGHVWSTLRNKVLSQHLDSAKRYLQSLLMRPDRKAGIPRYIHKLVAFTWLGNPPGELGVKKGQYCINHKDGNKLNNCMDNLEWVKVEDNTRHAWQNGLNTQIGETSTSSVFSSANVRDIRIRLINGEKPAHIAREYGVGKNCVEKLRMYANWKHQDHDLVLPMMAISNSTTLKAFYDLLLQDLVPSKAYERVEQQVPNGVVIEMREFRAARVDYNSWWHYSI